MVRPLTFEVDLSLLSERLGSVRIVAPTDFLKGSFRLERFAHRTTFLDELDSTEPDDSENEVQSPGAAPTRSATTTAESANDVLTSELVKSLEKYFIDEKFLIVGDKLGESKDTRCRCGCACRVNGVFIQLIESFALGEGQFGEVYYGKLIKDDGNRNGLAQQVLQEVAVKRLRYSQESFVKELFNEGQRMLNLDHPCIVKIFGVCKESVGVSLILELCPHGAMNRYLRANKSVRIEREELELLMVRSSSGLFE